MDIKSCLLEIIWNLEFGLLEFHLPVSWLMALRSMLCALRPEQVHPGTSNPFIFFLLSFILFFFLPSSTPPGLFFTGVLMNPGWDRGYDLSTPPGSSFLADGTNSSTSYYASSHSSIILPFQFSILQTPLPLLSIRQTIGRLSRDTRSSFSTFL